MVHAWKACGRNPSRVRVPPPPPNMSKNIDVNKKFDEWVKEISEAKDLDSLVKHLREHAGKHYEKYNRNTTDDLDVWLAGILNLMHILEAKRPGITREDMLFMLCLHYKNHNDGPRPSFDVNEFIDNYKGKFKKFNLRKGTSSKGN